MSTLGIPAFALKSAGLALGMAMLLVSSSAIAADPNTNQTPGDVQVDTQTGGTGSTTSGSESGGSTTADNGVRFSCQMINGQYTVMYHPKSQPGQAYSWATPTNMGSGWTPERRCNEIARRLEVYRPEGLQEMKIAVENNYNIICVTTQQNPACQIVLTVPPGQDPQATRDRVFQNLTVADSGQQTEAVNTFVNGGRDSQALNQVLQNIGLSSLGGNKPAGISGNINLRPFLDPADGGTGRRLTGGVAAPVRSNPRRLSPGNFR